MSNMPKFIAKTFNAMRIVDALYALFCALWAWYMVTQGHSVWAALIALSGAFSAVCCYYAWSPRLAAYVWDIMMRMERKFILIMALKTGRV